MQKPQVIVQTKEWTNYFQRVMNWMHNILPILLNLISLPRCLERHVYNSFAILRIIFLNMYHCYIAELFALTLWIIFSLLISTTINWSEFSHKILRLNFIQLYFLIACECSFLILSKPWNILLWFLSEGLSRWPEADYKEMLLVGLCGWGPLYYLYNKGLRKSDRESKNSNNNNNN